MDDNNNQNFNNTTTEVGINIGSALGMQDVTDAIAEADKAENFGATLKRLVKYLRPQMVLLFIMVALVGVGVWFAIWVPDVLKRVTDILIESMQFFEDLTGSTGRLTTQIAPILWTCVALYILAALFQFASGLVAGIMSQRVVRRMRIDVKDKLDKVPLKYFDETPTGDILSRVTNDIEMVSITLQESINQIVSGILTVIGVFIMMVRIDWLLAIIALVSLPMLFIISRIIIKRSQTEFAKQQNRIGELNGHIEEMYTGHRIVKLYNHEEESIVEYEKINDELRKATRRSQFLAGIILPSIRFVNNLAYVGICVVGGLRAGGLWGATVTIGDIQALLQYTRQFAQPIEQVSNIANTIQTAIAAAERVFAMFDLQEMENEDAKLVDVSSIKGDVVMKNVAFSYNPERKLITNLNLDVKAGESIAIVGPTGAGKTTLVNLLMRFYDIDNGSILIDGRDIRDYTKDALRSLYGMVLQDTWLYNGSVADNIAYGNREATREDIINAAKEAYAHNFIETMEHGYDTVLGEDAGNISAGQKQLLTIARAILKNPKIIILDEATSSVDTRTEKFIQSAMLAMMKDKTSFVIAHRLSTIKSANVILVMNQGDVVEQGSHDALMKKKGFYYELYQSQFAGRSDENKGDDTASEVAFELT
jgi:ATP-binding cassette subfamily B protein